MANEFARNITDAGLLATFALPTDVGSGNAKTSSGIDLGSDTYDAENIEVELLVPTLSSTIAPAASTAGVTYIIESSTSSTFNTIARTIMSKNIAGSANGVAQTALRARLPSDCEQYIRGKVTLGTTCTDASAVTATFALKF